MLPNTYKKNFTFPDFLKKLHQNIYGAFCFSVENSKPRYPYTLAGEKQRGKIDKTILYYRVSGKKDILEMEAGELCNSKELISRFHPLDVRTISFIAGIEQIIEVPTEERLHAFNKLKDNVLNRRK